MRAIEDAKSIESAKVRDAFAKVNFESLYGKIAFAANGQINLPIQVQGGKLVAIQGEKGPIELAKYPMPAWDARSSVIPTSRRHRCPTPSVGSYPSTPNAKAKTSSATGLGQFIDSTWIAVVQRHLLNGCLVGIDTSQECD